MTPHSFLGQTLFVPGIGGLVPPPAPANLQVTGASGGVVADLTPEGTCDAVAGATSYDWEIATTGALTGTPTATGQTNAYTFAEQANHYTYDIGVRAVNAGGPGPWTTITVHISVFTQSLGAEILTNPGNPFTFTGDNPDGFTITGESGSDPEVSEVGAGETHGGAGTGYVNLYSSATNFQPRITASLTAKLWYEINIDMDVKNSGQIFIPNPPGGLFDCRTNGDFGKIGHTANAGFQLTTFGVPADITFKTISIKSVTLNSAVSYGADGDFRFHFTLPGSPIGMNDAVLLFRVSNLANCDFWAVRIERTIANDNYDFYLTKYAGGNPTNLIVIGGVGTSINTLRAVCSGNDISVYTSTDDGANWTQRGTTQTDGTYASATNVLAAYHSSFTPRKVINAA